MKILKQHRTDIFGETMMLLYYVYLGPLTMRIGRGFYRDGVWLDSGFMPYEAIGGLTWREEPQPTLVVLPRMKRLAKLLTVPPQHYAEARRLLRDKITGHDIHFTGKALDLGVARRARRRLTTARACRARPCVCRMVLHAGGADADSSGRDARSGASRMAVPLSTRLAPRPRGRSLRPARARGRRVRRPVRAARRV